MAYQASLLSLARTGGRIELPQIKTEGNGRKKRLGSCSKSGEVCFFQRGHSLMVKFQPSKLAMRVRFPLPAHPGSPILLTPLW
jgi:hypothetical protein